MTGTSTLVFKTVALIAGAAVGGVIASFASFEEAFAGVRKTVEATEPELRAIERALRDLATQIPVDVRLLADMARLAGQFGIAAGDIAEFTRVMALLSVTIDDLPVEEAAAGLARIAQILQVPSSEFERLGSVLTDLGNKFASTEGAILDLAQRIAGASKIINLGAASVFGIANAFATVVGPQGVEAAGTAIQKVMLAINRATLEGGENLEKFAKVAGLSADEFRRLFETDPQEAFIRFVEGLSREGRNAEIILRDLGLADARLIRSFLQIAGAGDLLRRSVNTANTAFAENAALANEAAKRFQTLTSQARILIGQVRELGITLGEAIRPGLIRTFQELRDAFRDIGDALRPVFDLLNQALPSIGTGLADTLRGVGQLVAAFLQLFSAFSLQGLPALGEFIKGVSSLINLVAEILAPALQAIGRGLLDIVRVAERSFGAITGDVARAFGNIADGISKAIEEIVEAFEESLPVIAPLLVEMSEAFGRFVNAVGPDIAQFVVEFVERMVKVATALLNVLEVVGGPLLRVFAAVFDVVGDLALEISRSIQQGLGEALNELADALVDLIQALGPAFVELLRGILDVFVAITPVLAEFIREVAAIAPELIGAFQPLLSVLPGVLTILVRGLKDILPPLVTVIDAFVKNLAPVLQVVAPLLADVAVAIAEMVANLAPAVFKSLADSLIIIAPAAADLLRALVGGLVEAFRAMAPVLPTVASALADVMAAFASVAPTVLQAIGEALAIIAPAIAELAVALAEGLAAALEAIAPSLPDLAQAFADLAIALVPLVEPLTEVVIVIARLLTEVLTPAVVALLTTLVDAFTNLPKPVQEFLLLTAAGGWIGSKLATFLGSLGDFFGPGGKILNIVGGLGKLGDKLSGLPGVAGRAGGVLSRFAATLSTDVGPAVAGLGSKLGALAGASVPTAGAAGAASFAGAALAGVGLGVVLHNLIEDHFPGINRALEDFGGFLADTFLNATEDVQGFVGSAGEKLGDFGGFLTDATLNTIDFFKGLGGTIAGAVGDLGHLLFDVGKSIITGLIDGAKSIIVDSSWGQFWQDIGGSLYDFFAGSVEVKSPSRLFARAGQDIIEGLRQGVENNRNLIDEAVSRLVSIFDSLRDVPTRISDAFTATQNFFANLPRQISDAIGDVANTLQSVGHNLLVGIQRGAHNLLVDSGWGRFWQGIGANIADWLRLGTQSRSPSRLTMLIGQDIAQGLIQGFEGDLSSVQRTFTELVKGILAPQNFIITVGEGVGDDFVSGLITALERSKSQVTQAIQAMFVGPAIPTLPELQLPIPAVQVAPAGQKAVGGTAPVIGTLNVNEVTADPRVTAETVSTRVAREIVR